MGVSTVGAPPQGSGQVTSSGIKDDEIVNADINSAAAIDFSKLAALTSTNLLVGNGSNVAVAVAMSSDATMDNAGAVTIADNAVSLAKMAGITAGNLITGDASGDPAAVATGNSGQVLTSNGAGAAPTFQAAAGGGGTALIHHERGSTASATEVEVITETLSAATFGVLDVIYIQVIGHNTNESDNAKCIIRVADGTNTFDTPVAANDVYTLNQYWLKQGANATTQLVSLGHQTPGAAARPTSATITPSMAIATMISNWLSAEMTISVRGQTDGAGTGYYDLKIFKLNSS